MLGDALILAESSIFVDAILFFFGEHVLWTRLRTLKLFVMQTHIIFNDDDEEEQEEKVYYIQLASHHIVMPPAVSFVAFLSSTFPRHFRIRAASPTDRLMFPYSNFYSLFFNEYFFRESKQTSVVRCHPVIHVPKLQSKDARIVMCHMNTKLFSGAKSFVKLINSDFFLFFSVPFLFLIYLCANMRAVRCRLEPQMTFVAQPKHFRQRNYEIIEIVLSSAVLATNAIMVAPMWWRKCFLHFENFHITLYLLWTGNEKQKQKKTGNIKECSRFDEHACASVWHFSVICGFWVCRPEVMWRICKHHPVEWNNRV